MIINNINEEKIDNAISELENFIRDSANLLFFKGWNYFLTNNAPENFRELLSFKKGKIIPIANYGNNSIYSDDKINGMFRFYHDVVHLELNANFSREGEYMTSDKHIEDGKKYGLSELALTILKIDTRSQVDYYFLHKKFVKNQKTFLYSCLQHGSKTAIKIIH